MCALSTAESIMAKSVSDLILDQIDACILVYESGSLEILYSNCRAKYLTGDIKNLSHLSWMQIKNEDSDTFAIPGNFDSKSNNAHQPRLAMDPMDKKWYQIFDKTIEWTNNQKAKMLILYSIDYRMQDERKQQFVYGELELFSMIAISFSKNESFASKIIEVLKLTGQFVDVSRVSLYEKLKSKTYPTLTYEWCSDSQATKLNHFKDLKFNPLHASYRNIVNNDLLNIEDLNKAELASFFELFHPFAVKALLMLPLFIHQKHVGYIAFEECRSTRKWLNEEIQLLKTVGNIISTSFERKSLEEDRIRAEQKLMKANAAKEKFFSLITNDLQAPFSALTSLSTMLLENYKKWPDEKRILFVESIKESSRQGYMLLENLITWSKIQSGTIDFFPKDVDIRSAINLAVEQLIEKARNKNIRISGMPEEFTFVYADYHMLHSIIKNLLSNAIKFTEENGEIIIDMKKGDDFAEVSVYDNGVGIERAYLKSLFKIDRLSADFGPTLEKGTGLGLIICREFVEKNGGKIWAESKFGLGSCFKFTVPLSKY